MWLLLVAVFASFVMGVGFSIYIVHKFRKLPSAGQTYRLASGGWEAVNDASTGDETSLHAEQTRPVEPIEMDQLLVSGSKPKGIAVFEEKTRQVQEFEFADLLQVDHEEMVAEPLPTDNEEQVEIAREDSRLLKIAIEKSGPVGVRDVMHPQAMLQAVQPSHFVYTSRGTGTGLLN
ncbi:hypothetical protein KKD52_05580 [Myxococcota bacterium]|nr:hypothetical protein [Myxococcota bacterium]MBU1413708.1 hypothetical protein [Myxococcota bacterium]MBU1509811.1 hypothetical protein [Myxococcota bacterium]